MSSSKEVPDVPDSVEGCVGWVSASVFICFGAVETVCSSVEGSGELDSVVEAVSCVDVSVGIGFVEVRTSVLSDGGS